MSNKNVVLENYNVNWPTIFNEERAKLLSVVAEHILTIEHVGSTSIPGMRAKPIIDIAIAINNFEEGKICIAPIVELGYRYKGEYGIAKRHYFVRGEPSTYHLHMLEKESSDWQTMIKFRDYLIANQATADQYANLKSTLAIEFAHDRPAYQEAKGVFIKEVLHLIDE